jgi:hypothetical protein
MEEVEMDGARGFHGKDKNACRMLMENLKEIDYLEDPGVDGSLSILERWDGRMWTGVGDMAGCCEHGNELRGLVECGKLLFQARNCYLVKESAPRSGLISHSVRQPVNS